MQFRIVGAHQHKAIVGPSTFLCVRRDTMSDAGIAWRWIASRNGVVLKDDCRTLNDAKNLCRQVSAEEQLLNTTAASGADQALSPRSVMWNRDLLLSDPALGKSGPQPKSVP